VTCARASSVAVVVLLSACAPRENRTADTPAAKVATPVARIDTAPVPVAPAGSAGDKWSVPAKAKSDDDLAAADTFDLIAVGAAALPVADTVSLVDVNCTGLLTSARYILDGNRNFLWAYTRDRGTPTNPRCAGGVLREDEDGGYRLTADSIEFLRFDDGHGYRTAAGRIVRDTLEVRRGARLEHYVRVGRRGSR
jgi:hypothetical protein